jgi:hypothetical protein
MGIVIHIAEVLARIKPKDPLRLAKCEARKKRNCKEIYIFLFYLFLKERAGKTFATCFVRDLRRVF